MNDTKFSITNYNGCTISCSKSQWDSHIVYEHKIMAKNFEAVKDTIKDPDSVYQSNQNEKREIYFKASSLSTYSLKTKVIVEYSPSKKDPSISVGEVVTAFPQKEEKGGIGDVVYKRTPN